LNSLELFFTVSAEMLKKLQVNTCTTEYTSIKKVHATLVNFIFLNHKRIPLKMLVTPSPLAGRNGRCIAKPTTPTKGEDEKEQMK
jgi:hypothetical protein